MSRRLLYPLSTWVFWVLVVPLGVVLLGLGLILLTDVGLLPFDNLDLWWLVAAVPLAGLLYLYGAIRRRHALDTFTSAQLAPLLAARVSPPRQAMRAGAFVLAVLLLVVAIIGPRWGMYLEEREAYGVDVVVALDVSRSMLARDLKPDRLKRAQREIREQLTERSTFSRSNRLGLLAFAGSTSMKVPLTLDHPFFREALASIRVGSAPRGGTAIAEAIYAAADSFASSPEEAAKIILLFTDGEDHEGNPVAAAGDVYEEYGVRTFTIGVGDAALTAGAEVPSDESADAGPLTYDGQIVFSKLHVDGLRQIAQAGHGRYAALDDLRLLIDAIASMQKEHLTTEERKRHKPRYQWFLATSLLLLTLETIMGERKALGDRHADPRLATGDVGMMRRFSNSACAIPHRHRAAGFSPRGDSDSGVSHDCARLHSGFMPRRTTRRLPLLVIAMLAVGLLTKPTCAQEEQQTQRDSATTPAVIAEEIESPHELVREGNRLLEAGDLAAALENYRNAQDQKPDALEIDFNKALAHLKLKEYDAAREAFDRASLGRNRSLADDAVFGLAACDHSEVLDGVNNDPTQAIGKLEAAMRHYQDVLSSNPQHTIAREANCKAATLWRELKQIQQQQQQQNQEQDQKTEDQQSKEQQESQSDQQQEQQQEEKGQQPQQEQEEKQEEQASKEPEDQEQQQMQQAEARQQEGESREQAIRQLRKLMDQLRKRKKTRPEAVPPTVVVPVEKDW